MEALCPTCKGDLLSQGQLLRCRRHFVADLATARSELASLKAENERLRGVAEAARRVYDMANKETSSEKFASEGEPYTVYQNWLWVFDNLDEEIAALAPPEATEGSNG